MITYSAAISACERGQKPQQALHLLQELQLRGLLPDVITYNAAISAREKGQKPQQALHLLQELQLRGLLPDVMRSFRKTVAPCYYFSRSPACRLIDYWLSFQWVSNSFRGHSLGQTAMNSLIGFVLRALSGGGRRDLGRS